MDAMANTAARGDNLAEHAAGQWAFIETTPEVRKAGALLINYIDGDGYFRTDFEIVQQESKSRSSSRTFTKPAADPERSNPPASARATCASVCSFSSTALRDDEERAEGHDFELEAGADHGASQRPRDESLPADQQAPRAVDRRIEGRGEAPRAASPVSRQTRRRQRPAADHAGRDHFLRRGDRPHTRSR